MPRILALLATLCFAATAGSAVAKPPNIVLIVADDLGWADLGCYGNRFNETPRIDKLATQGVRFTDFYSAGPVCSPTRAAIQSGQYQARFGLTAHIPGHWRPFERLAEPPCALELPLEVITIAERLREAGYATGYFGKWHLGGRGFGPKDQGYETVYEAQGHTVPGRQQPPPGSGPRRACDYLAELTEKFIEANKAGPFFVQVSPFAVHIPLNTTPELQAKYEAKPKAPGYASHPLYAGLLEELDQCVGRVLDALDRHGLAKDTLVIFTSDNGGLERESGGWPGTTNAPLRNEKGSLYEGGIRVPTIVRWPGVTRMGVVTNRPAISVDFYPTALEAAGLKPDAKRPPDGVSLVPVLRDPAPDLNRDTLFWHYPHYHHSRPSGAIRSREWKLIEFFDTGAVELYRLSEDIGEATDLAPKNQPMADALRERLRIWRKSVGAQMPQRNPAYDPKRAGEWWNRARVEKTDAPGTPKAAGKNR